jgi:hypothetical protein
MFSLENELQKRLDLIVGVENEIARKNELENELNLINGKLATINVAELNNEVDEIKHLLGLDKVVEENVVEENNENLGE